MVGCLMLGSPKVSVRLTLFENYRSLSRNQMFLCLMFSTVLVPAPVTFTSSLPDYSIKNILLLIIACYKSICSPGRMLVPIVKLDSDRSMGAQMNSSVTCATCHVTTVNTTPRPASGHPLWSPLKRLDSVNAHLAKDFLTTFDYSSCIQTPGARAANIDFKIITKHDKTSRQPLNKAARHLALALALVSVPRA
jgi:hypothetical protein